MRKATKRISWGQTLDRQEQLITIYLWVCKQYRALPMYIGVTGGGENEGKVFDHIRPQLHGLCLCADKAYQRPDQEPIKQEQGLVVLTPVKKAKGQKTLEPADKAYSTAVSRLRQPIESWFAWIEQKSRIQYASRVRSYAGLIVHVFGRLAATFFFWKYLRG